MCPPHAPQVLLSLFDMEVWSEATATAVAAAPSPAAAAAVLVDLANALHAEVRLHRFTRVAPFSA